MQIPENLPYRRGANGIVINSDGNYLLLNKFFYDPNQWDFPGGGIKKDETPEQALMRELEEETGTDNYEIVYKTTFQFSYEFPQEQIIQMYKDNPKKVYRGQIKDLYIVKFLGDINEVKPTQETKEIKWVSYEELKDHLVFENQFENYNKGIQEYLAQKQ